MKNLDELINKDEPGWDLVKEWLVGAKNHYEILPKEISRAEVELVNAQVTTRSPMGAIVYETGGILIDHGWVRVLGSGSSRLDRGLMEWNKGKSLGFLLVADDVIGGYFAINGGAFGSEPGNIYYLAPDTLEWENLDFSYSDFLNWLLHGNIRKFYEPFKWQNWLEDTRKINGNQVFQFFPFLWTKYDCIEDLNRKAISVEENYALTLEMQNQLSGE